MEKGYLAIRIIENLLLPPGGPILLALVALLLVIFSRRMIVLSLLTGALILIYLAAIPATTGWLNSYIDIPEPLSFDSPQQAEAIVVLGASRYRDAPEYGGDTLSSFGLERIRYAARLQRKTGLPILATGGKPTGEIVSEAELMKQVLEKEFSVTVKWIETESSTTWENSLFSSQILQQEGIHKILLVTHAWHMARAKGAFEKNGMIVTPAATRYYRKSPLSRGALGWIPNAAAQYQNWYLFHEIVGGWWYQYKY
jgi:uncharacterized SAM-binding protein YcdF (DUF218 family)